MNILAIDASANICSVALSCDGKTISRTSSTPRAHAQQIVPMVQALVAEAAIELHSVDYIAYGCGPGSFTGLRIALSFAQGLGFALSKPLVPISSLLGLAASADRLEEGTEVFSVLDARMNELYWAGYRYDNQMFYETSAAKLQSIEAVNEALQARFPAGLAGNSKVQFVGPGVACLDTGSVSDKVTCDSSVEPNAASFIKLAYDAISRQHVVVADRAELTYLRNSVSWNKRQRIRQS